MQDKLKWCCNLNDGLKIIEPEELLAKSYLNEAKSSLRRAEKDFNDGDLLWATVVVYYAEYYALYAFLQRIGIKCENHFCSILAVEKILGKDKLNLISSHKDNRIDAQYYMRTGKQEQVSTNLKEAKIFVAEFDTLVSNLTTDEIQKFREKFAELIK